MRIAQVAVFAAGSAAATTTDPAVNAATAGVNAAFLAYMLKILESTNDGNIPFILPFKDGQGQVFLLMVIVIVGVSLTIYGIKQYLKLCQAAYKFGAGGIFKRSPKVQFIRIK